MSKGTGEGFISETIMEELERVIPGLVEKARNGSRSAMIRCKCFDCVNGHKPSEVKNCPVTDCWIWPARNGRIERKK
jgi:hypothetical protein